MRDHFTTPSKKRQPVPVQVLDKLASQGRVATHKIGAGLPRELDHVELLKYLVHEQRVYKRKIKVWEPQIFDGFRFEVANPEPRSPDTLRIRLPGTTAEYLFSGRSKGWRRSRKPIVMGLNEEAPLTPDQVKFYAQPPDKLLATIKGLHSSLLGVMDFRKDLLTPEIIKYLESTGYKFDSKRQASGRTVKDNSGREWAPRRGLEGPFLFQGRRVLYYDPREKGGTYYDPTTDMYLSHDEAYRITSPSRPTKPTRGKWAMTETPTQASIWAAWDTLQGVDRVKDREAFASAAYDFFTDASMEDGLENTALGRLAEKMAKKVRQVEKQSHSWRSAYNLWLKGHDIDLDRLANDLSKTRGVIAVALQALSKLASVQRSSPAIWENINLYYDRAMKASRTAITAFDKAIQMVRTEGSGRMARDLGRRDNTLLATHEKRWAKTNKAFGDKLAAALSGSGAEKAEVSQDGWGNVSVRLNIGPLFKIRYYGVHWQLGGSTVPNANMRPSFSCTFFPSLGRRDWPNLPVGQLEHDVTKATVKILKNILGSFGQVFETKGKYQGAGVRIDEANLERTWGGLSKAAGPLGKAVSRILKGYQTTYETQREAIIEKVEAQIKQHEVGASNSLKNEKTMKEREQEEEADWYATQASRHALQILRLKEQLKTLMGKKAKSKGRVVTPRDPAARSQAEHGARGQGKHHNRNRDVAKGHSRKQKHKNKEAVGRLARGFMRMVAQEVSNRAASYSGNPDGKPIYDVDVAHGEGQALSGGHDIMKRMQDSYRIEQGNEPRETNPRLARRGRS